MSAFDRFLLVFVASHKIHRLQVLLLGMNRYFSFLDVIKDENAALSLRQQIPISGRVSKMLDLGFESPTTLEVAYHVLGIELMTGVDKDSERDLINRCLEGEHTSVSRYGRFSWYDYYSQNVTPDSNTYPPKIKTKQVYDTIFRLRHNIGMLDFLRRNSEQFGLVILSNSLHHIPTRKQALEILRLIKWAIRDGGIFYIRVKEFDKNRVFKLMPLNIYHDLMEEVFGKDNFKVCLQETNEVPTPEEGRALTFWNF